MSFLQNYNKKLDFSAQPSGLNLGGGFFARSPSSLNPFAAPALDTTQQTTARAGTTQKDSSAVADSSLMTVDRLMRELEIK